MGLELTGLGCKNLKARFSRFGPVVVQSLFPHDQKMNSFRIAG